MNVRILFLLLSLSCKSFSQDNSIIELAFSDSSNFDITTSFLDKRPEKIYVLNKTQKWNTTRFKMDEDLSSRKVIKRLEQDEHSPYNHTYIFKDPELDDLFSQNEKNFLYEGSKAQVPRQLPDTFEHFRIIRSFNEAPDGFLFSVTDPVFTSDKQYAFIDISVCKKDETSENMNQSYFGNTLLIYRKIKNKGWIKLHKRDHVIL